MYVTQIRIYVNLLYVGRYVYMYARMYVCMHLCTKSTILLYELPAKCDVCTNIHNNIMHVCTYTCM